MVAGGIFRNCDFRGCDFPTLESDPDPELFPPGFVPFAALCGWTLIVIPHPSVGTRRVKSGQRFVRRASRVASRQPASAAIWTRWLS